MSIISSRYDEIDLATVLVVAKDYKMRVFLFLKRVFTTIKSQAKEKFKTPSPSWFLAPIQSPMHPIETYSNRTYMLIEVFSHKEFFRDGQTTNQHV
jgi:hypothetical protein